MKKILMLGLVFVSILFAISTRSIPRTEVKAEFETPSNISFGANSYVNYLPEEPHFPNLDYELSYQNLDYVKSVGFELRENVPGATYEKAVYGDDEGNLTFVFDNAEEGYYNILIRYYPIEGKSGSIERNIRINDVRPFDLADRIILKRIWVNARNEFLQDTNGNDIVPKQIEAPRWIEHDIRDANGYIQESLAFHFNEGINTISLHSVREPILIDYLRLYHKQTPPSYMEYMTNNAHRPNNVAPGTAVKVQGQNMFEKTSPTLYPIIDRTSPLTTPQHHAKLKLNAGGGINYRLVGDWISYQVEAPEDGFYRLSMVAKQTYLRGAYVTRSIRIDGEIPFRELEKIPFNYSNWRMVTLGESEPYEIYLTKGMHTISLEVALGDFAEAIQDIENVIDSLNGIYRQIIMITSTTPDQYRDYQLTTRIPQLKPTFEVELSRINSVIDRLVAVSGELGDRTAALSQIAIQLEGFIERPQTIHQRLGDFRNNISALGTWVLNIREQPLAIDYLVLHAPDFKLPRVQANFFEKIWFEIKSFFASFFVDYNALSTTGTTASGGEITVWVGSGRDQANIIRRLIDESFTPEKNINVRLQLVPESVLLPATFTGKGPDVMMGVGNTTPVNYAMRNAVHDLSTFPDFDVVMSQFKESAILPYRFEGGVYAMPEQHIFPVLFYREDILKEIGVIPADADEAFWQEFTWDDVIDMIPELQRLNLEFYLPIDIVEQQLGGIIPPNLIYVSLLYQQGGSLYTEDGSRTLLQERKAIDTFKMWTDFYTNYRFTIAANFANRFRTGEMPIGIAYYTMYNMLSVFAPEISGQWKFTVIPGTLQADGSVDHTTPATGIGTIILNQSKNKQAAWEYLKWWGSEETQVQFGREMEGIMGAAARYPTANVGALEKLPWPSRDIRVLLEQWDAVRGIPEVPGSYITGRYMDNALRMVVNTGVNPRETLYRYAELINDEIKNKRKEFGLE